LLTNEDFNFYGKNKIFIFADRKPKKRFEYSLFLLGIQNTGFRKDYIDL
jgi:hypothetical protein